MDRFYISGLMYWFLLVVYLPLVLLVLVWVWRRVLPAGWGWKLGGTVVYLVLVFLLPLGDVLYTNWQMARLCPDAGLHVYRSVEVDGFYSEVGLVPREELGKGYQYVEFAAPGQRLGWVERGADGVVIEGSCPREDASCKPRSRYWLTSTTNEAILSSVLRDEYRVVDHDTGEVLGRSTSYAALPGQLDRWLLQMFDPVVWTCGEFSDRVLQERILMPRRGQ